MGAEKIVKQSGFATGYTDRMVARLNLQKSYRTAGLLLPGGDSIFSKPQESIEPPTMDLDDMIDVAKKAAKKANDNKHDEPAAADDEADEVIDMDERLVQVFSLSDLAEAEIRVRRAAKETRDRVEKAIAIAKHQNGFRRIPKFDAEGLLGDLLDKFENFAPVIRCLKSEFFFADIGCPHEFRIAPILLDGPPGVGKTAFAQQLAEALSLPYKKISAGGMQHAAQITGTSSHWSSAQTGEVFNLLTAGEFATGILVIDEVDKLSDRSEYSILPALLDLLEPASAKQFTDVSIGVPFDASRLIVVMTSNTTETLHPALLSRCQIFSIDAPGIEQKKRVARMEHARLCESTSRQIALDEAAVCDLAEQDIDIRRLLMAVKDGFIRAIEDGSGVSSPSLPDDACERSKQRSIGFI